VQSRTLADRDQLRYVEVSDTSANRRKRLNLDVCSGTVWADPNKLRRV
jgi:hypothetical protein